MGPRMYWPERCSIFRSEEHMHMRISHRSAELLNSKLGTFVTKPQVQYFVLFSIYSSIWHHIRCRFGQLLFSMYIFDVSYSLCPKETIKLIQKYFKFIFGNRNLSWFIGTGDWPSGWSIKNSGSLNRRIERRWIGCYGVVRHCISSWIHGPCRHVWC